MNYHNFGPEDAKPGGYSHQAWRFQPPGIAMKLKIGRIVCRYEHGGLVTSERGFYAGKSDSKRQ